jgi:hypothetical protein
VTDHGRPRCLVHPQPRSRSAGVRFGTEARTLALGRGTGRAIRASVDAVHSAGARARVPGVFQSIRVPGL